MKLARRGLVLMTAGVLLLLFIGVGVGSWIVITTNASSGEHSAERRAEDYLELAERGDYAGTYELLAAEAKEMISPEDWQRRNEEAVGITGPLLSSELLAVDANGLDAYATLRLVYGKNEPLVVVISLAKEGDEWKLLPSVDDRGSDQWEEVR